MAISILIDVTDLSLLDHAYEPTGSTLGGGNPEVKLNFSTKDEAIAYLIAKGYTTEDEAEDDLDYLYLAA